MIILLIALLFLTPPLAFYLGYQLHRRKEKRFRRRWLRRIPRSYFVGLNFLLNDETDKAVDIFTKMLGVDSDTIETHLAVGKLFRRKGEVDRAIRIHQNLIARAQLPKRYREQSMYELGQDYLSAGVLDHAEKIFVELINSKSYAHAALKMLIDIYQQERDWYNALKMAKQYETLTQHDMRHIITHCYCEIAESAASKEEIKEAECAVQEALLVDATSVRASLLQAKFYMQRDRYKEALCSLLQISDRNLAHFSESVKLLALCYEKLGLEEELMVEFKRLLEQQPSVALALVLAERIHKVNGSKVALIFVLDYVRRHPSLRGLYLLINFYTFTAEEHAKQDLSILQNLMNKILSQKPDYQCKGCGFASHKLHWQCPGCRQWDTVVEG